MSGKRCFCMLWTVAVALVWHFGVSCADGNDFRFVRLSMEPERTSGNSTFVLEYTATELPQATLVDYEGPPFQHIPIEQELGTIKFTVPHGGYMYSNLELIITVEDVKYTLPLGGWSYGIAYNATEEVPTAHMEILPGNDVTYEDGDDAIFISNVHLDMGTRNLDKSECSVSLTRLAFSSIMGSYSKIQYAVTDRADNDEPENEGIQIFSDLPTPKLLHSQITVQTSRERLDGILLVSHKVVLEPVPSGILPYLKIEKEIRLYHSDHEGPFPGGSIGFSFDLPDVFDPRLDDIEFEETCIGYFCEVSCSAVGAHPKSLEIVRVLENGDQVTVSPGVEETSRETSQINTKYFMEHPSPDVAGRYDCIAKTPTTEIRKTIQLRYF